MGRGRKDNTHTAVLIIIVLAVIIVGGGGLAIILFSAELPNIMSELEGGAAIPETPITQPPAEQPVVKVDFYSKAMETGDPSFCGQVDDIGERDNCYITLALERTDVSLCDDVVEELKPFCLQQMSQATGDESGCEGIDNATQRDACYELFAQNTGTIDVCSKISDQTERYDCIAWFAITGNDHTICSMIGDELMKTGCIFEIAKLSGDESICDSIENQDFRSECKESI